MKKENKSQHSFSTQSISISVLGFMRRMIPMLALMSAFVFIGVNRAQGSVVANSSTEFSGIQGQNGWYYGYYVGRPTSASDFQLMTQFVRGYISAYGTSYPTFGTDLWMIGPNYWTALGNLGGHPSARDWSCGRTAANQWATRRWVSEVAGTIQIEGTLRDLYGTVDGTTEHILVDGVEVWQRFLPAGGSSTYALSASVTVGSTVDFAIEAGGNDCNDHVEFTATISADLIPPPPPPSGTLLASSFDDFSNTQGHKGWYYGYYVGPPSSGSDFQLMTQFVPGYGATFGLDAWMIGPNYWTALGNLGGHPSARDWSCGRTAANQWATRRWVSEVAGTIQIEGTLRDLYGTVDGTTEHILVDGVEVWQRFLPAGGSSTYALSASVTVGSTVDFAIEAGGNDCNDHVEFTAKIWGDPNANLYAEISDNFNDGDANGWELLPGARGLPALWSVEDGVLVQRGTDDYIMALADAHAFSDQSIEVRVSTIGYAGVVLWYKDSSNFLSASIYPFSKGLMVIESFDGRLNEFHYESRTNTLQSYDLRVDADSTTGRLAIYLDGAYIFTYEVSTPHRTGLSGVFAGNEVGYFDDFRARETNLRPQGSSWSIFAASTGSGIVTPAGDTIVATGNSQNYTFTPATGYRIDSVVVDGANLGPRTSYTFSNVTADHTLVVNFVKDVYTIKASVVSGSGTLTPAGVTTVAGGSSQTYTVSPAVGYKIAYVAVNGAAVKLAADNTYAFSSVRMNYTITVSFIPVTYTVTVTQTPNGYITPYTFSGFKAGASQTYKITPDAGYRIATLTVDGVDQKPVSSWPFTSIQGDHTITATFEANPSYKITATATGSGSITPLGEKTLLGGQSQRYMIAAATGYRIDKVVVNGVSKGAITSYTFSAIASNQSIDAYFVPDTYTITANVVSGSGTLTPAGMTTVPGGGAQVYTVSPAAGYKIAYVAVNGAAVKLAADNTYAFSSVRMNYTITVSFVPVTYTITVTQTPNGYVTPYTFNGFTAGASQTYNITPNSGCKVVDVSVDGASQGAIRSYPFTNIVDNHTIQATFSCP